MLYDILVIKIYFCFLYFVLLWFFVLIDFVWFMFYLLGIVNWIYFINVCLYYFFNIDYKLIILLDY